MRGIIVALSIIFAIIILAIYSHLASIETEYTKLTISGLVISTEPPNFTVESFSDNTYEKILEFYKNETFYIKIFSNMTILNASFDISGLRIINVSGTPATNLLNGNFELDDNFTDWQLAGDPSDCAHDAYCSLMFCDLRNETCSVSGMFINTTNRFRGHDSLFGERVVILGHYPDVPHTYFNSKIHLQQRITIPNEEVILSFYIKSINYQDVYHHNVLIDGGGPLNQIWTLYNPYVFSGDDIDEWTLLNFTLINYAGKNITLIFRIHQDFIHRDVTWSGENYFYIDNVQITTKNSTTYTDTYPQSPGIDIQSDGSGEWSYTGTLNTSVTVSNISNSIEEYLRNCTIDNNNYCLIPINVIANSSSKIRISNISIIATDPKSPEINDISFEPSLLQGEYQNILVKAYDNSEVENVYVDLISLSSNETLSGTLISGQSWNGTWKVMVNVQEAKNYSFIVNVTDAYGNYIESETYTFNVEKDSIPPNISITNFNETINDTNCSGYYFSLYPKITDNVGISSVEIIIRSPDGKTTTEYMDDWGNDYWYYYDSLNFSGSYDLYVMATDVNGNIKTTEKYYFEFNGCGCGDGICTQNETYSNCCVDCPCPSGQSCQNNGCVDEEPETPSASPATPSASVNINITYEYREIIPGKVANITIKENVSIRGISIEVRNPVNNVDIKIVKLEEKPVQVAQPSVGKVYEYLEFNATNITDNDIEKVKMDFKVTRTWIMKNRINRNTVKLNRHFNDSWRELNTSIIGEDPEFFHYEALVPGFSYFAITGEEIPGLPQTCIANITTCIGNVLGQCNAEGTGWLDLEICEYDCDNHILSCNPEPDIDWTSAWYLAIVLLVISAVIAAYFVIKRLSRRLGKPKTTEEALNWKP